MREGLIDIVQAQPYAPLHVRATGPTRTLHVVADNPQAGEPDHAADTRKAPADEDAP
jgi:hypothetical protein